MSGYLWNILVSVDQLVNTLTGGSPDETISLRAKRARAAGAQWGCVLCKVLDVFDKGHCDKVNT
jgi:hypothetical protein